MTPPLVHAPWRAVLTLHRLGMVALLGFASGLPLALTGQSLQAWMSAEGLDVATIGFLSLVGLPYTFKFLWAPLLDRFEWPRWARRRAWIALSQALLALALWQLSQVSPLQQLKLYAAWAVAVAFLSASQDVVIDAYRTEVLPPAERGLGASLSVMGYRMAMIVSGGLAFIWTDAQQGGGLSWAQVYLGMAALMAGASVMSLLCLPSVPPPHEAQAPDRVSPARDLLGFLGVVACVALGVWATDRWGLALATAGLQPLLQATGLDAGQQGKWLNLATFVLGLALTVPAAAWVARRLRFQALLSGLDSYFAQPQAMAFLAFIVLYKLGDAFAGTLMTPFLLQGMAYSGAEVGVVNKVLGLWLTLGGALLGGLLMVRWGLWRALWWFGWLQLLSNLGFAWLAQAGRGAWGSLWLPAFDWGFVKLAAPTPVDGGLLAVIAFENLSGGMGTAAFVAFLMGLCQQRYTATQFALLSALAAVGRVWVGPVAGVLASSVGWPVFFALSTAAALPALAMLWRLRPAVQALDVKREPAAA